MTCCIRDRSFDFVAFIAEYDRSQGTDDRAMTRKISTNSLTSSQGVGGGVLRKSAQKLPRAISFALVSEAEAPDANTFIVTLAVSLKFCFGNMNLVDLLSNFLKFSSSCRVKFAAERT